MNSAKVPPSLRGTPAAGRLGIGAELEPKRGAAAAACLIAAGSITSAEAQQAPSALPALTVDAPVARPRPAPPKPSVAHVKARTSIRQRARVARHEPRAAARVAAAAPAAHPASAVPAGTGLPILARAADANPYADPVAPYKANRLSSNKFTEPLANTPRTVTVLTKELLDDKSATTFKEVARTTAGVTLGTGEGGNAFGDRFFIRGFDARNDIFVDGVRDPAVSIRENFFTEQIEILRGPASSFAGRGTAGGAVNIVLKKAGDQNFYNAETQLGTDATRRITVDINQVISPVLAVRADGLFQTADVAGRKYVYDDRWGGAFAATFTPTNWITMTANYLHTDLNSLPDFGVPYNVKAHLPFTSTGVPSDTFYGFVNRDFQKARQDLATFDTQVRANDFITLNNKFRAERSILDYIGTIPESPNLTNANPQLWTVTDNPQSRYQSTDVLADQTDATVKFATGPIQHTAVFGTEFSYERVSIDKYTGLSSELVTGTPFNGSGSVVIPVFNPPNLIPFGTKPSLVGNPTVIPVNTKSGYVTETANYKDFIIVNGGVRYDDYDVSASNKQGSISASSGMLNYNGGIVVKPLPYASVYAAYATSSDPVGAELDGTSTNYGGLSPTVTAPQVFGPTQARATEVGTKWELFDRHLLLTGALFETEVSNARESIGSGAATKIVAGAAYKVQGIDLEAAGKITDRWSVAGGLVLMDPRVTKSAVASNVGLRLANIANQSFNVLTKYEVTPWLELGGQAVYASQVYGGTLLAANQGTVLPSHWRFDTFIEGNVTKNLKYKVAVLNIFNKVYYDAMYQSAAPFVLQAPGRSAQFTLEAKF